MTTPIRTLPPGSGEFAPYYEKYIAMVPPGDLVATLEVQRREAAALLRSIPEARGDFAYAEGKWTVKEVLGHVGDCERVFAYRAMRIGRNDKTPLTGFDHDEYVRQAKYSARSIVDLASEFDHIRIATIDLFSHFDEAAWLRIGNASNHDISVRALGWIIAGHVRHHLGVIQNKYL